MKTIHSAKFVTVLYFSVVAFALIAIHVTVYWNTTEELEHIYGQNRLDKAREHAIRLLADKDIKSLTSMPLNTSGNTEFDKGTELVFDFSLLPDWLPSPSNMPLNEGMEALSKDTDEAYFIMRTAFETGNGAREAVLLMDFRLYEVSEEQLFRGHVKQVAISVVMLVISLFVVIRISDRLTKPISRFAGILADKPTEDLSPVRLPEGRQTRELREMEDTFNRYQARIHSLLERERRFSRYASHEMRTPLTVMKGALTLLEESDDPEFSAVQRERLKQAVNEMIEVIETVLNLTRTDRAEEQVPRCLTEEEVSSIAREYEHLLGGKQINWRVTVAGEPQISMPEPTFRILLGNLVRNSFTYAQNGEVLIEAFPGGITVSDAGAEHTDADHLKEGFGLGLLLVRDICHRFGWRISHEDNHRGGWTMRVSFGEATA